MSRAPPPAPAPRARPGDTLSTATVTLATAQYAFTARDETELSVQPGDRVVVVAAIDNDWWVHMDRPLCCDDHLGHAHHGHHGHHLLCGRSTAHRVQIIDHTVVNLSAHS
jgi:hypothetical protein